MVGAISGYHLLHQARSLSTLTNYTWPFTTTLWSSSAEHTLYLGNGKKSPGTQQLLPDFGWSSVKHRSDFDVCLHMFLISILGNTGIQGRISLKPGVEFSVVSSATLHGLAELKSSHMWNTQKCYSSFTRLMFKPWSGVTRASAGHNRDSLVEEQTEICTATAFNHALCQRYQLFPYGR